MKYCQSFKENNDYNQMPLLGRFYQTEPSNFIKRLWHWCFPANFAKFLRTLFFHRTPPVVTSGDCKLCLPKFIRQSDFPF